MNSEFTSTIPTEEQEEIKNIVSLYLLLPKEDRAVLLSNANAFRVRHDIERARDSHRDKQLQEA